MNPVKSLAGAAALLAVASVAQAEELSPTMQQCINNVALAEFIRQRPDLVTESDLDHQARATTNIVRLVAACDIQFSQFSAVGAYMTRMSEAIEKQLEQHTPSVAAAEAPPPHRPAEAPLRRGRMTRDGCQSR
jgi:hypothetical protein